MLITVLIYKISTIVADPSNILKKQGHGPKAPYHFELFQACAQFKNTDKGAH